MVQKSEICEKVNCSCPYQFIVNKCPKDVSISRYTAISSTIVRVAATMGYVTLNYREKYH